MRATSSRSRSHAASEACPRPLSVFSKVRASALYLQSSGSERLAEDGICLDAPRNGRERISHTMNYILHR